jgi:hypothetical protein
MDCDVPPLATTPAGLRYGAVLAALPAWGMWRRMGQGFCRAREGGMVCLCATRQSPGRVLKWLLPDESLTLAGSTEQ